jgi:hypothetical protein
VLAAAVPAVSTVAEAVATELSATSPVDDGGEDVAGDDEPVEDGTGDDGESEDVDVDDPEHAAPARPSTVMPPMRRNERRSVDGELMATIKHRIGEQCPTPPRESVGKCEYGRRTKV